MRNNCSDLKLDEFGRLAREGDSDSDISESPRSRRHEKRAGKRYRSQSRSPSPWRRRIRSPRYREDRGKQSHRKQSSRSRSPASRHYNEFTGDREKGNRRQPFECFDFKRGRCYRGASCRFLHHLPEKAGTVRYTRGQESHPGSPRTSGSPELHKSKILPDEEAKDELTHDLHAFEEAEKSKELPSTFTDLNPDKLVNLEPCSLAAADAIIQNNVSASSVALLSRKIDSSSTDPREHNSQKLSLLFPDHSLTGYGSNPMDNGPARSKDGIMQQSHLALPLQNLSASYPYSLSQCNSGMMQPPMNGGLPSDIKSSNNLNQPGHGMQSSSGINVMGNFKITPCSHQPEVKDYLGPGIPYSSYPSVPAANPPMSSEFVPNTLLAENDATGGTKDSAPCSFSHLRKGMCRSAGDDEMLVSSTALGLSDMVVSRSRDSDQYDPLVDSIEPSISGENQAKYEAFDGSANVSTGFEGTLNMEAFNQEGRTAVSDNISSETEEYEATADKEVDAGLNASTSDPNSDVIGMKVRENDGGHVKVSGKNKSKDSRSTKAFKISIANFVKEALKPSWRQGDMSKEAFKTIVKKTIDKVSGAMSRQKIPKSQPKIDRYIDSSRQKLTKLVMGYVEKYVKA